MAWFNDRKINTKIVSGFILLAIMTLLVGIIGIMNLNQVSQSDQLLYQNMTLPLTDINEIAVAFQKIRVDTRDMILANDAQLIKTYTDDIERNKAKITETGNSFEKSLLSPEEKSAYREFLRSQENYEVLVEQLTVLAEAKQDEAAFALMIQDSSKATANAEQVAIDKLVSLKADGAAQKADNNGSSAQNAAKSMLVFICLAVLMALIMGILIARNISRPVTKLVEVVDQLAAGDVDVAIEVNSKNEVGVLMASMARMVDNIKEQANAVERIAAGDLRIKLQAKSDKDLINNSLNNCMQAITELVNDANFLAQAAVEGKLDTRADASKHRGDYRTIIEGVNATLDAVIGPLNVAAEYIERIANGDTPPKITDEYNGDFNEIKNNLNVCIDEISLLVEEVGYVINASIEGRLDQRANADRVKGVYCKILTGINDSLDALIGPLNVAAEYVDRISKGDVPDKISDNYKGDFNEIKNNLNMCIDGLGGMIESSVVLKKMSVNDYTSQVEGQYQGVFAETAASVNEVRNRLLGVQRTVTNISRGDLSNLAEYHAVGRRCEADQLMPAFIAMMENIEEMADDANLLTEAAVEGRLDTRVDASKHEGIYARIIEGINATLDALIGPLNVAAEYVDRISKGDIPEKISDNYKGDFNEIKNNLNMCIEGLGGLVESSAVLKKMSINDYSSQVEGRYQGVFADTAASVNEVRNRLLAILKLVSNISRGDLSNLAEYHRVGKRCEEDQLMPAFTIMMENIEEMSNDATLLTQAAVEGKLDTRVDVSKHQGIYARIIEGINATLDAVIGPTQEAVSVLQELLVGNLKARVKGDYKGDHAISKQAANDIGQALETMIGEISDILTRMSNGDLTVNMERDFRGDFIGISNAIKLMIVSLNEVLGDIDYAAEQVAGTSEQVSDSSQALAQGASEQASAIEQLTAAITQIAAQTKQNAGNANQANELALHAKDNAVTGNLQMKEMLGAMEGINESSANISKIIKVIDEIAFQTNILALNAAVEAARAGQHGKGFAVVAEEVRNLAARSASAAKETTDLIEGSIHKVNIGTRIANETAQALDKIVEGVSQAVVLVGDIAVASNEQATGIAQVDQGINQVSQVIQTNSATAQQSAAASEELSSQAGVLKERVARFQLKDKVSSDRGTGYKDLSLGNRRQARNAVVTGITQAAAGSSNRARIALDDGDYGKY